MNPQKALARFGLNPARFSFEPVQAGYINHTWKVMGDSGSYILQRLNQQVFKKPFAVDNNIRLAAHHLHKFHPEYIFPTLFPSPEGDTLVQTSHDEYWRIFVYIDFSYSINEVVAPDQAFRAAAGFARLMNNLQGADATTFEETIPGFHNLEWRWYQFVTALEGTSAALREEAAQEIARAFEFEFLVNHYKEAIQRGTLTRRIVHNDTKINNILFDSRSGEVVCVIDLDTLMPGYFIYDFGDMVRTCVSAVNENERDLTKINFRPEIYEALKTGYLSEARDLSSGEIELMPFAGQMMTYIMALRMLTDFLNGNIYYQVSYREMNLHRAMNQFALLDLLHRNL